LLYSTAITVVIGFFHISSPGADPALVRLDTYDMPGLNDCQGTLTFSGILISPFNEKEEYGRQRVDNQCYNY
jgi:hypothetical protein